MVEAGAKAAIFPRADQFRRCRLAFALDVDCDLTNADVRRWRCRTRPTTSCRSREAAGIPVQMVFIGTCTGGRAVDFHEALAMPSRVPAGGWLPEFSWS